MATNLSWQPQHADLDGQAFTVRGLRDTYEVTIPLVGEYQQENAATAIAAAETLIGKGHPLTTADILDGLRNVRWPGRFQVLGRDDPQVIADGAHNPYSMRRFVEALTQHVNFEHLFIVFGAVSGHSAVGMLEELAALDPTVIAVQSRHPKAATVEEIAEAAQAAGVSAVMEHGGVGVATRRALALAAKDDAWSARARSPWWAR